MQDGRKKSRKPGKVVAGTVADLIVNGGLPIAQATIEAEAAAAEADRGELGLTGGIMGALKGTYDIALSIRKLVKGSATLKTVIDVNKAIQAAKAAPKVRLTDAEEEGLNRASDALPPLIEKIKKRHVAVNASKVGGNGLIMVGGGLAIAGPVFPPAVVPGMALAVAGTAGNFVASLIELSFKHRWKFAEIMAKLGKEGGLWVLPLGANQEVDQAEQPNTDDATCEQESEINARVRPKDKARLLTSKILTALGPVLSVGFERPRDPPPTYADVIEEDRRKMDK